MFDRLREKGGPISDDTRVARRQWRRGVGRVCRPFARRREIIRRPHNRGAERAAQRSRNAGDSLRRHSIASFVDESRSPPRFERRRAWIIRSENGGSSFSTPFLVSNDVCGPPPVFQLSALVADASEGPSRDRLYFACRQSGGGTVVIVSSKDRGKTWNRPGVAVGPTTIDVNTRRVMTLAVIMRVSSEPSSPSEERSMVRRACSSCSPRRLMQESRLAPLSRSRRQNAGNQRQKKSRNEDIPRTATTLE